MYSSTWDQIVGQWNQVAGALRRRWGRLTHDRNQRKIGERQILAGKLRARYGLSQAEAYRRIKNWETYL